MSSLRCRHCAGLRGRLGATFGSNWCEREYRKPTDAMVNQRCLALQLSLSPMHKQNTSTVQR
jgi:hypothetical protein